MKMWSGIGLLVGLLGIAFADERAGQIPSVVISDPAPDPANPPHSAQVLIPSHGMGMNGLFYLAGGPGPHPTMLLLHGFPGNEQNLDLAQAIRRAGWNVLTMHYRGSWGSPGSYRFAQNLEDGEAVLAFLRDPANAATNNAGIAATTPT